MRLSFQHVYYNSFLVIFQIIKAQLSRFRQLEQFFIVSLSATPNTQCFYESSVCV